MRNESARIISRYNGIFTSPPKHVPDIKVVDGPILGNGDVGVVISGKPDAQRVWISKCDFWKARPGAFNGGSPRLIGGIDISIPQIEGATYNVEQHLYEPEIKAVFSKADVVVTMRFWVAAVENLLIVELSCTGQAVSVAANLWVEAGDGADTRQKISKDLCWIVRKFNTCDLDWPSAAAAAMRCLGADSNVFTLEAGRPVTLVVSILTNHDTAAYLENSRKRASQLDADEVKSIRAAHNKWWREFWSESFVEIGDPLLEKFYYGSQYIMASCSRNKNFAPGLYGNWITTDKPEWSSDYHLNYNHEAPWWGVYSSNHVALSEPYDAPILDFIAKGKEYAKRVLNCRGVYYPGAIGPQGLDIAAGPGGYGGFMGQKSDAVFAGANMFMRFYYTCDLEYAKKVYPYLIEVANFWEDYLKFEDDRYVIHNDNLYEADSWNRAGHEEGYVLDTNPTLSLGMVRMLFKGLLEMSAELRVDAGRHEKWRHILDHISEFPMKEIDGKKRFCGAERGPSANVIGAGCVMLQGIVWPSGIVGLDSDPELLQNLRKDLKTYFEGDWQKDGNGFPTMFPAAARLGFDPTLILANLRKKIQASGFPNLWIFQGGGGIETCAGITACVNEMLLQSHENVLRLFPVWPKDQQARFGRLRAVGAFLVSAALLDGQVQDVMIESEKGRNCTVQNPWPGNAVMLYRNGKKGESFTGERLTFDTEKGERIVMRPYEM